MIKIEMQMPNSCYECKKTRSSTLFENVFYCIKDNRVIEFNVNTFKNKKRDDCPLIEVKE